MDIHNWLLFASIALIATITPGPAVLLISTQSISHGPLRAVQGILGNITGLFIMSLLSVLGLSAIVLYSTTVFFTVKLLGAIYLIYLGIKLWKNGFSWSQPADRPRTESRPGFFKLFAQGLFVALSNPKAIAFTTALFPQFVDHSKPLAFQFAVLVTTFMLFSSTCLFGYALISAGAKNRTRHTKFSRYMSKLFGAAFVGSGIALATASK